MHMKNFTFLLLFVISLNSTRAQQAEKICKAVHKENYRPLERFVKKQIKLRKHGSTYYNGPGSGMQVSHVGSLDSITGLLKSLDCIADAAWDKCQIKIAIYPGGSTIGVILNTSNGKREMCFSVQEGTTGNVRLLGCRMKLFKARNILVFKNRKECSDFVRQQKALCTPKK